MTGVLALFPELTDVNGDAQNALVLARRAVWAGHRDVGVERLAAGEAPATTPIAVVLGSTTDPMLPRLLAALQELRDDLEGWIEDGVPVLAVGTGLEALTRGVALPGAGSTVSGSCPRSRSRCPPARPATSSSERPRATSSATRTTPGASCWTRA
ncbi:hypothetical protein [Amnibacterium kyonggiense]